MDHIKKGDIVKRLAGLGKQEFFPAGGPCKVEEIVNGTALVRMGLVLFTPVSVADLAPIDKRDLAIGMVGSLQYVAALVAEVVQWRIEAGFLSADEIDYWDGVADKLKQLELSIHSPTEQG